MSQPFKQSVTFTLDRAHLEECYGQSAPPVQPRDYARASILGVMSVGLIFVEAAHYYVPFFLFCLAILELFSIQYRQTWWVWRQLLGKSANGQVTLIVDEQGITTESKHVNSRILWQDVKGIQQTPKGLLLKHAGGVNYLSNAHLGDELCGFIVRQAE